MQQTGSRKEKAAVIRHLMQTEGASVAQNTRGFNQGRYASVARLDNYEALKRRARQIKEEAIGRLPELVEQLTATVEAAGGTVYLAEDAADANRHIVNLCREQEARRLVKSKSMTSEEIEVNAALEKAGLEVVETDLGEWVLQVAEEHPSHIVAPALHKSRAEIARLFNERFQPEEPLESAEELTRFAREKLGELIKGADVGMTGANFITADTGTLCLITSEGNARKTAFVPPAYIAVAGVEKIVPSVEDLQPFVELIGRSGTGQDVTSYVSLFTPPFDTPPPDFNRPDGPLHRNGEAPGRSFHLVLIDNGRLAMREDDQLRETLYCIRCSACANTCANFQSVGGHAFGGETYSGGIATGWEAGVHGLESAATFNDLCTGCSRCVTACPVGIDIPWINTVVRDRLNHQDGDEGGYDWLVSGLLPDGGGEGLERAKRLFGNFQHLARLGSRTAPLSNWMARTRPMRYVMERLFGVDRRRELPAFERVTLRRWFEQRTPPSEAAGHEVVLFCDAYTNYVHTGRGKAAVRALEALGVQVRLSQTEDSGRAPLSQGMIAAAEEKARAVRDELIEHLEAGRAIVTVEPSDLAMFKRDYQKLLPDADYRQLAEQSVEVMDYIRQLIAAGANPDVLQGGGGQKLAYHSHCQQRTLGLEAPTIALLEDLGYDVMTSDVECCGMAGSFGYKTEYYELSMDVGERLGEQFSADEARDRTLVASGTSCLEQLEALMERPAQHPVELIAPQ